MVHTVRVNVPSRDGSRWVDGCAERNLAGARARARIIELRNWIIWGGATVSHMIEYNRAVFFPKGDMKIRMLLRVSIPVEAGNAAAKAGTIGSTIEQILADLKPEAAYFFADDTAVRLHRV